MSTNFHYLKGRIAEQLIQDLFSHNNYKVFNYGIERVMPGIRSQLPQNYFKKGNKALRFMPAFCVAKQGWWRPYLPGSKIPCKRKFQYRRTG